MPAAPVAPPGTAPPPPLPPPLRGPAGGAAPRPPRLAAAGSGTEIYYPSPLPLQPALAELGYRAGACPAAEAACAELVALPPYPP